MIGIDPGKQGAIAWTSDDGTYNVCRMPLDTTQMAKTAQQLYDDGHRTVYLEFVHSMPGNAARAMFTFGEGYGKIKQAFEPLFDVKYVRPQIWQDALCIPRFKEKALRKAMLKHVAEQLFPDIRVTLWNCDALLILDYGVSK